MKPPSPAVPKSDPLFLHCITGTEAKWCDKYISYNISLLPGHNALQTNSVATPFTDTTQCISFALKRQRSTLNACVLTIILQHSLCKQSLCVCCAVHVCPCKVGNSESAPYISHVTHTLSLGSDDNSLPFSLSSISLLFSELDDGLVPRVLL